MTIITALHNKPLMACKKLAEEKLDRSAKSKKTNKHGGYYLPRISAIEGRECWCDMTVTRWAGIRGSGREGRGTI